MTMIIATHEMAFARDVADEVCFLHEGRDPRARRGRADLQRSRSSRRRSASCDGCWRRDRRAQRASPAAQQSSRWRAKRPSSSASAAAPQRMSRGERRVLRRQAAGEVDRRDVLVHGVGDHVLVVELRRGAVEAEPAQAVAVAPVRHRRGHLEQRQVADDRAAQPPVQPEQRHEVHGRERDRRQGVDVGAVAGVEPERVHRAGEQCRVDARPGRRRRTRRPGSRPARPSGRRAGAGAPRSAGRPP